MREFAPVSPAIWSSPAFRALDGDSRQLLLFYICGPHATSAGCSRVREGYALADLGWAASQYRTALARLVAAGLVLHDPGTEETYVKKWFTHKGNAPANSSHAKGTRKIIERIDSDDIRLQVEEDFMECEWAKKTFPPGGGPEPHFLDPPNRGGIAGSRLVTGLR